MSPLATEFAAWITEKFSVSNEAADWCLSFAFDPEAAWCFRVLEGTSGCLMLHQLLRDGVAFPNAIDAVLKRPKTKPFVLEIVE